MVAVDWRFEQTEDGRLRLVKVEEDYIDDAEQLTRLLRQLLHERSLLEKDLQRLDRKIAAVKEALDVLLGTEEGKE